MATVHPDLPWALGPLVTFVSVWAVRRWRPTWWIAVFSWLPASAGPTGKLVATTSQAFVSALPFALVAGVAGGNVVEALKGLGVGLGAPVLHHVLKAIRAVPYRGALAVEEDQLPPWSGRSTKQQEPET